MKKRILACLGILISLVVVFSSTPVRYTTFAFHPFTRKNDSDLKLLTWNVHCSKGAEVENQTRLAELLLNEDADIILLNEYYQDSCKVVDSILKIRYPYTEEFQSHRLSGDIFYSKLKMSNSGHPYIRDLKRFHEGGETFPDSLIGKVLQPIRATVCVGTDSVQIFGVHLASNSPGTQLSYGYIDEARDSKSYFKRYKLAQVDRCFQAKWTKEFILESEHPVIVMGDMNDFSKSAPLDYFTSCGLVNAWQKGGFGLGTTFHSGLMRLRIDHILYGPPGCLKGVENSKGLELVDIKVISTRLSDHNPIVASFNLK